DAREPDQVAALLRLLAILVEPQTDFRTARDFFADRVDVLIPRQRFTRHDQLAGPRTVEVVPFADRPLHQLGPRVDDIVRIETAAAGASPRAGGRTAI